MTTCYVPDACHGSDDELVARLNRGDWQEPMQVLQARYKARLMRLILGIVKDVHLAQDVCQETMVKVFLKSHLYTVGTNFRAWLFEIARNQALSAIRSRRRAPVPLSSLALGDDDEGNSMLDQLAELVANESGRSLLEKELLAAFETAVAALPEKYRIVFVGCTMQDRTYQEMAHLLSIPTGTVAIRIMRARKRLFAALAPHLGRIRRPPACAS